VINDPKLLEKPLTMAFNHFDKDKSGYIEGSEILAVVEKVSRTFGLQKAPTPAVNVIFDKVAGPDGRLDMAEFKTLLQKMFEMAHQQAKEKIGAVTAGAKAAVGGGAKAATTA
jgi:Ca2+-binding EF-hand superfamily protein